ncbi:MAG TPA: UbiH/UbiF/VisC/COQ6 family ubiquinone biosynthesis hydroxylase [Methylophaga sp.]|nr:UbiH/UbiF/VisC/COQ6 family ubiquinone biosynthesis hydroxylase [Methylophaga sp.]
MKRHTDIIIVGGGMVGGSLALALAQHSDLKISLLESRPPAKLQQNDPWQLRVSAINKASQKLLTELGVWQHLMPSRLGPFEQIQVWEKNSQLDFAAADIGAAWLGHIIENSHLEQAMFEALQVTKSIDLLSPAKATALNQQTITLDNGDQLSAPLIIAADGGQSHIRDWAGIKSRGWAYQQHALVAVVETEHPHQQCARQHFLLGGPLAFLPLNHPHQCSIVWSLPDTEAEHLKTIDDLAFCEQLASAFDFKLGDIRLLSERAAFPLHLQHADTYVTPGLALVGDAAHSVHPLAGQGVNLGFQDVKVLSDIVLKAHQQGRPLGSLHTLKKYQRARLAENALMQLSLDSLNRLFASQLPGMAAIRQLGLKQVNRMGFIKNMLIQQAAGQR